MKDMQAHLEKLQRDAAECKLIADLATEKEKRELFSRLAEHLSVWLTRSGAPLKRAGRRARSSPTTRGVAPNRSASMTRLYSGACVPSYPVKYGAWKTRLCSSGKAGPGTPALGAALGPCAAGKQEASFSQCPA